MSISHEPQLILMAAGMSRRFGILKQLDVFESCGHSLPEFILHDAIRAGFRRIIIVVREEIHSAMKDFYMPRFAHRVDLRFVVQSIDDVPPGFQAPSSRSKPWGTAHAILAAREHIEAPFASVNSDDFYGRTAFAALYKALAAAKQDTQFFLIAYELQNTLSATGPVSRALCQSQNKAAFALEEHLHLAREGSHVVSRDAAGEELARFTGTEMVSMNLYGLSPAFCDYAWKSFADFLQQDAATLDSAEFLLPTVIQSMVTASVASLHLIPCKEAWFGMTYLQDRPIVEKKLLQLWQQGQYTGMH